MSNQLQTKAAALAQILAANRLTKAAADQEIEHKDLVEGQNNLGAEQTAEIHQNIDGVNADTPAADNTSSDTVQDLPGVQDLNASPEQALASSGTTVDTIQPNGDATGTPAEQAKTASVYRARLANILSAMNKKASAGEDNFRTGMEVLEKFASLTPQSTAEDIARAQEDLVKLASSNPVFQVVRDRIIMEKMAADIDALAEAEGISPEEAANELQAAAEDNPEMAQEIEDEANGEAVAELADAEAATDQLMGDIQGMADNASNALGVEVTPEDIVNAADETAAMAEQLGVPPEVLIQQAMEELQAGAEGGMPEVTPEDEANAQMILDEAAANGVSPEEVIQIAAEELQGGAPAEEAPAAEGGEEEAEEEDDDDDKECCGKPGCEEGKCEKAASLQKRASTTRAAFVQHLRHTRGR